MLFYRILDEHNQNTQWSYCYKANYEMELIIKALGNTFTIDDLEKYDEETGDKTLITGLGYYGNTVVAFDYNPSKILDLRGEFDDDDCDIDYLYDDKELELKTIQKAKNDGYDMIIVDDQEEGNPHDSYIILKSLKEIKQGVER